MAERKKAVDATRLSSAHTAEALLDALLAAFPDRSGMISRQRFGVIDGQEKTLEEIGQLHGITRERVRQIVDVIIKRVSEVMAKEYDHLLVKSILETIKSSGGMVALDDILTTHGGERASERKALQALLPSFPGCQIHKENERHKCVVMHESFELRAWEKLITEVIKILEDVQEVQSLDELHALYSARPGAVRLTRAEFEALLAPSAKIEKNAFGRYGLAHWSMVRPRGTRERAHLILQVMKKPLHFREIAKLIDEHGLYKAGKKTHPQTVHNELIKDKRFVLVGRGTYALSDWGFRPGTVREVIASVLKEHAQPMTREELLKAVMKVRQVKRSTVIINLNSFFKKVGKHVYALAETKK